MNKLPFGYCKIQDLNDKIYHFDYPIPTYETPIYVVIIDNKPSLYISKEEAQDVAKQFHGQIYKEYIG